MISSIGLDIDLLKMRSLKPFYNQATRLLISPSNKKMDMIEAKSLSVYIIAFELARQNFDWKTNELMSYY